MAASLPNFGRNWIRVCPLILQTFRQSKIQKVPVNLWVYLPASFVKTSSFCTAASLESDDASKGVKELSRYKDRPWDYLESEEYIERYGTNHVWADYRRNHKGAIPPQKTRKTCIRGGKTCGNPCPICRDPNITVHYQNVQLLQQFLSPYTGIIYDPTRTGVCMKQQKQLNQAIKQAQDHGLLPIKIPHVDFLGEDYSNCHGAVCCTPPPPSMSSSEPWYKWYDTIEPDQKEVAKVKKLYKAYLK